MGAPARKMPMAYNTGNPIGSTSPKDLADNAQNLDLLMLGENSSYLDRKGGQRRSWKGLETAFDITQTQRESSFASSQASRATEFAAEQGDRVAVFNAFIDASGYEPPVPYMPGLILERTTQTVSYLGNEYRVKSQFLPLKTTTWAVDEPKLKLIGDDSLRQDMANVTDPTKGAAILGRVGVVIASVKDMGAAPRKTDVAIILKDWHPSINTGGGGNLYYIADMPKSKHNGGTVFSPTVPWNGAKATVPAYLVGMGETDPAGLGCFVRRERDYYLITMFGAVADWDAVSKTGFDNRPSIEATVKSVYKTVIPKGRYGVGLAGSVLLQGYIGKRIEGGGSLHKMGSKGIFSLNSCIDVKFGTIEMDGQIVRDEAENGSILTGTRLSANYAFAISFKDCHDCDVIGTTVYDFAWDGIVAQGTVAVGGLTAVQSTNINLNQNTLSSIRGSQLWIKAVKGGEIMNNRQFNPETFWQKGNAVFVVEWCEDIEVASNRQFYIGDNGVGVGEMVNRIAPARNKNIQVHHNLINMTRYHAILFAPAEDSVAHHNTIHRAGAKSVMVGSSGAVTCGAITILGGGNAPSNLRVKAHHNTIHDAYEHGIYALDRTATALADSSVGIELDSNTIYRSGKLETTTRLASSGITTQLQKSVSLWGNTIDDIVGDGIRVFGDANVAENTITRTTGVGLHIPSDTIWGNTRLSSAISGNTLSDMPGSGMIVANKASVVLTGNTALRCGRTGSAPASETTATALNRSGISLRSIKRVQMTNNEMRDCGSCGLITQFCDSVKDTGSVFSGNGQEFVTPDFKAGAYLEGNSLGSPSVVATFMSPVGDGGATQYYPIRIVFGLPGSVSLDSAFVNHSSASLGITEKSLINI